MSEHPISQRRRDHLLETASAWVVRIQEGELSPGELEAWSQWLQASPNHQRAFDDVQKLWRKFGQLPCAAPPPSPAELKKDAYSGEQSIRSWREGTRPRRQVAQQYGLRWRGWVAAAAVVLAIGLAVLGVSQYHPSSEPGLAAYRTVIGQHQKVALPDGSSMELGAASEAKVVFTATERTVELLDGIAFFAVAKNPQRPFVVRAGGGAVKAIGTEFSVQRSDSTVTVVVSDGLVEVSKPSPLKATPRARDRNRQPDVVQLPAGQRVEYSTGAGLELPVTADLTAANAWRDGQLVFHDESLRKAIEDINRYSRIPIELKDQKVARLRLTAYVTTNQIEGWLEGLEAVLPVKVEHLPERIELSYRGADISQQ